MKQKIVIKVCMNCDRARSKAMKVAAETCGVISMAIEGSDLDQLVVMGEGIDSASLTRTLRKKVGDAMILKVEEVKPAEKKVEKKEDPPKCCWSCPPPPSKCGSCCPPPPPPPKCGSYCPPPPCPPPPPPCPPPPPPPPCAPCPYYWGGCERQPSHCAFM